MSKHYVLDRTDRLILGLLAKNARLSNKDLATQVDISPSTCWERVRSLREMGALRGEHAEVDPAAFEIGLQAMVAIRLRQHSREFVNDFRQHALKLPEVIALYHVAGHADFLVHVCARDPDHLKDFALDAFTTRREVASIETSLIFEYVRNPELPDYGGD